MHPTHPTPTATVVDNLEPSPAEILRCAALYLRRHGWTQRDMFTDPDQPTPAACTIGAIRMAICGNTGTVYTHVQAAQTNDTLRVLAGYLDTLYYLWGSNEHGEPAPACEVIGDWNDNAENTADTIITTLTDAATDWDHTHGGDPA